MVEFALSAAVAVAATVLVFSASRKLYERLGYAILNPVLVSILVLIALLKIFDVDYTTYDRGGRLIRFFLEPTVVALGVPLYRHMGRVLKQRKVFAISILAGAVMGICSGTVTATLLGASPEVALSIAPRSVTTPIAIGIAEEVGGIPSLTAAIVIATGVLGAVLGPMTLRWLGVHSRTAFGLGIGAAAHGIGTARAVEEGEIEGASSGLAIGLMGVATAVLAPPIVSAFLWLWSYV